MSKKGNMIDQQRGKFIVLEGVEGAGKTTQIPLLETFLKTGEIPVLKTLEPGGTIVGRRIREILLDPNLPAMAALTELLLYNAARAQHVEEVIKPALNAGTYVICDRFSDSTLAYQGYGRELDHDIINRLDEIATGGLIPDLTIILDLSVNVGLARNAGAGKIDRMELESLEFHERVKNGFHEIAARKSHAVLISAVGGPEEVQQRIQKVIKEHLCL